MFSQQAEGKGKRAHGQGAAWDLEFRPQFIVLYLEARVTQEGTEKPGAPMHSLWLLRSLQHLLLAFRQQAPLV